MSFHQQRKAGRFIGNTRRSVFFKSFRKESGNSIDHDHEHLTNCVDLTSVGAEEEVPAVEPPSYFDDTWKKGRRIVELDVLAKAMFCCQCRLPLHLSDTVGERKGGLGSHLFIQCSSSGCGAVTDVPTGKTGPTGSFDVTDKVAIGKKSVEVDCI